MFFVTQTFLEMFFLEMYEQMMVCSSEPCQNGGTCHKLSYGRFRCDCAEGFVGPKCEGRMPGIFVEILMFEQYTETYFTYLRKY